MIKHLFFFGKSQSFSFQAFDENEIIEDYDQFIRDFDKLESSVFTIDRTENEDILAYYKFSKGSKSFSLLKLYSFAQAYSGERVEGSTYGVAFLSDHDIELTSRNIKLLISLKTAFGNLSLTGRKFRYADFSNDARRTWLGFKKQSYFALIDTGGPVRVPVEQIPLGVELDEFHNVSEEIRNLTNERSNVYFTEDRSHLERAKKKWGDHFDVVMFEGSALILNPDLTKQKTENKENIYETNTAEQKTIDRSTLDSLNTELFQLKSKLHSKNKTITHIKRFSFLLMFIALIALSAFGYLFFEKISSTEEHAITNDDVKSIPRMIDSENIKKESLKTQSLTTAIYKFDSLYRETNKENGDKLKREIAFHIASAGIDTGNIKSIRIRQPLSVNKKTKKIN
jgi:hypothetical protein